MEFLTAKPKADGLRSPEKGQALRSRQSRPFLTLRQAVAVLMAFWAVAGAAADDRPSGADLFPDLYSPRLLGEGAFVTQQGGAEELAVNPASGGDAQRMVFDAGYTGILAEDRIGSFINLGALFPTKFAVLGASVRYAGSPSPYFLDKESAFLLNAAASKELYPGLSAGVGLNMGVGSGDWANLSADLGFRYNMGKRGPVENVTWAVVARSVGLSYAPSPFTLVGGASADVLRVRSNAVGKAAPLVLTALVDLSFPSFQNFTGKLGASALIAGIVTVSTSWGFNVKELMDNDERKPMLIPSVGLGVHFTLKSTGNRMAGGALPTDGDISIATGLKPLYHGVYAAGAGVTWAAGVRDDQPPVITATYPETAFISPNNDGVQDALEFPVTITDQRYITQWVMEVRNEDGETVRTYRNKERRIETQGFWEVVKRIQEVKGGVAIPESLRWDGTYEDGRVVPDGVYYFVISAKDDNDNEAVTRRYEVIVDNTPPDVQVAAISLADRIFSPDGDGNKDTLAIGLSGSVEDFWDAGFYDAAGNKVRAFDMSENAPAPIVWNGMNDNGALVPDGVYRFSIASTDRAGNHAEESLANIVVSTIQPAVRISLSDAYLSPNGDGVKDTVGLNFEVPVTEGITGWTLEIRDNTSGAASVRRVFGGVSPAPVSIDYDGRDDMRNVLPEGVYRAVFSVTYRNGFVATDRSPPFTIDVTPPQVTVRAAYDAFSPNKNEMDVIQSGSSEVLWRGEIRNVANPNAPPVRVFRFAGTPTASIKWDGHTDAGALAPDGQYFYELSATDRAGNFNSDKTKDFTLSTADTSVMLTTDLRAFSPNGDRVKDTVNLIPQIKSRDGITSWQAWILNGQGEEVRTFAGTQTVPQNITWDGKNNAGTTAADGQYTGKISLAYRQGQGDESTAETRPFILDTAVPDGVVNAPYTVFSPNGDGRRDTLPLGVRTTGTDMWEASIISVAGANAGTTGAPPVRAWNWTGAAPEITWDGTDENGNIAANGTYRFVLTSTDEAGNTTRREVQPITLDARTPRIFFTESGAAIAPKPGTDARITFTPSLSFSDGIESWELVLKDAAGSTIKFFNNRSENRASPGDSIVWNGFDDSGAAREGLVTPVLTVVWTKGDVATAESDPIMVDVSGPILEFVTSPEFFSPDNDDVDDELFIALGITDASPVASWSLDIREPQTNRLFYHIEGKGQPAGRLIWDGRSNTEGGVSGGELVQSASDYPYTFKAADSLGNESSMDGVIGIDVLVIRDGDNLKIAVPSIQFRSNAADFNGLPAAVVATNNRVLNRVAQILNKFRDYKVKVEGHANPTTLPGPAREREETEELLPLSEDRAEAVVNILVRNGVARSRLSSTGVGGGRTVAPWDDENNRWKNRRVEFILIK
jgi:flagellar hook assembly protein FlgD/outer membrane protein OmpA-like peptidoglycan-associated protein